MTAILLRTLWKPLAALLALLGIYAKGRADARAKSAAQDAVAYRETRKEMDHADIENLGDDPDLARRLMREREPDQR